MAKSVQLWLGPTGSGRSQGVIEEIRKEVQARPIGAPLLWIVPDETAFAAEQMLMASIDSALRPEVITLRRLAERVRTSAGRGGRVINRVGRNILLRAAYEDVRDSLGPLKRAVAGTGLYEQILAVFDEMIRYEVDLQALEGAIETAAARIDEMDHPHHSRAAASLFGKLRDVCTLYVRYRELLQQHDLFDPALTLTDASHVADEVSWLRASQVFVDGFNLFAPQELRLITALIEQADRAVVVLGDVQPDDLVTFAQRRDSLAKWPRLQDWLHQCGSVDAERGDPAHLYSVARLVSILQERGISWETVSFTPGKRFAKPELLRLERALAGQPGNLDGHTESVRLWRAADEETEIQAVVDEIVSLLERGDALGREIAVVCPSLDNYGRRLAESFVQAGVAHAIDVFPTLDEHPLGHFLTKSIALVQSNMSAAAVASWIRSAYSGLSAEDRDRFDLYIRMYDVSGSAVWFQDQPWTFAQEVTDDAIETTREDQFANRIRVQLATKLQPFVAACSAPTIRLEDFAVAIWQLLQAFDVKAKVAAAVVNGDAQASVLAASVEEQAWNQCIALLDDLAGIYPDVRLPQRDVLNLVLDALRRERLATIPSSVDQVFICDYRRADHWTKPYVFVVGADDTHLPLRPGDTGILRDDEREMFTRAFGVPLGFTQTEQHLVFQRVAYQVLTRASKLLTVSWAVRAGVKEHEAAAHVRFVANALGVTVTDVQLPEAGPANDVQVPIVRPDRALHMLVQQLADVRRGVTWNEVLAAPTVQDVLDYFLDTSVERRQMLRGSLRGLVHRPNRGQLPPDLAEDLFGRPLRTSVHRLETFAACPERHFLQYGLKLEPLSFAAVRPQDVGTFLHDVAQALIARLLDLEATGVSLADADEQVVSAADAVFEEQIQRAKYRRLQAERVGGVSIADLLQGVQWLARAFWRQLHDSAFRPYGLERSYGLGEEAWPPLAWTTNEGTEVELRGRIDRVDLFERDGVSWFRILDYKSNANTKLDATKVFYGLQLQLLTYAEVVRRQLSEESSVAKPAGVHYMPLLASQGIKNAPQSLSRDKILGMCRAKGYMHASHDVIEAMDRQLIAGGVTPLFSGVLKTNGEYRKDAEVWSDEEWQHVTQFVWSWVERTANRIMAGDIGAQPYFIKHTDSGCTNCPFGMVCHFEHADHHASYRVLQTRTFADVLSAKEVESR
ncbi:PD-(D/E)XK nuclease family protein [Alicyclobacillus hesperidum]|uniref:PD-(D/E)XK nuclease family protein n=1 Tax=Alicyclobacillus hesperidum TaxID=89784 RepID=UPI0009447DA1|nr:PD-(D/E)XK nuclease family protein [Alicyclobacillus hesperidum]